MRPLYTLLANFIASILVGCLVAVTVIPINLIVLSLWLVLVWFCYARLHMRSSVIVQPLGLALVLFSAAIAPVKTTQHILKSVITFDARKMTLDQLDAYLSSPDNRERMPVRIQLAFSEGDKDEVLNLPSESISVADFIDAIQSQTQLRSRFEHCGNGWTLLWGGDCGSGLIIVDSGLFGAHPKKQFRRE